MDRRPVCQLTQISAVFHFTSNQKKQLGMIVLHQDLVKVRWGDYTEWYLSQYDSQIEFQIELHNCNSIDIGLFTYTFICGLLRHVSVASEWRENQKALWVIYTSVTVIVDLVPSTLRQMERYSWWRQGFPWGEVSEGELNHWWNVDSGSEQQTVFLNVQLTHLHRAEWTWFISVLFWSGNWLFHLQHTQWVNDFFQFTNEKHVLFLYKTPLLVLTLLGYFSWVLID